jgi:WD40 repeat protein
MELPAHNYAIYSIVFVNGICATASRDKTIKIWDAQTMDCLQRIDAKANGHSHSINKLLCIQDCIVSCSDDKKIIVWKTE